MRLERWIYTVPLRLRALFRRRQLDHELDEELQDHIERQIAEHIAKGLTPEQARTVVLRGFRGVERRKEECRDMTRTQFLEQLWRDTRLAARSLLRSRSFAAVAVLSLGLGIGAKTAIFTLVDQIVLRLLPINRTRQRLRIPIQRRSIMPSVSRTVAWLRGGRNTKVTKSLTTKNTKEHEERGHEEEINWFSSCSSRLRALRVLRG